MATLCAIRAAAFEAGRKVGSDEGYLAGCRDEFWNSREEHDDAEKRHMRALEECRLTTVKEGENRGQKEERLHWVSAGHGDNCRVSKQCADNGTQTRDELKTLPSPPLPPSAPFIWADEPPLVLPAVPLAHGTRDLSALQSKSRKPFDTLQRRHRRFRTTKRHCITQQNQQRTSHSPEIATVVNIETTPISYLSTQHRRSRISPTKPTFSPAQQSLWPPTSCLHWDQDPILVGFSRVLKVLSWTRCDTRDVG